jgi:anti-repressor protein
MMVGEIINAMAGPEFQTPIEVALGVDENGMTTAKKLYDFLEMDKSHYSRWVKSNILENQFAEENIDYWAFAIDGERDFNPNPTQDFKLTAHFAKKLSMKGNSTRAEEAREYFTRVEEKIKQLLINRSNLSPQMQLITMLVESMSRQELEQKQQAKRMAELENSQKAIRTAMLGPVEQTFKEWASSCLSTIAESPSYPYQGDRTERHQAVRAESYERLNRKRPCRLKQRVETEKGRAIIAGASAERVRAINKLSIIEADKTLKPLYETVIREMMIAYQIELPGAAEK